MGSAGRTSSRACVLPNPGLLRLAPEPEVRLVHRDKSAEFLN
jgi:hypothetical protein